MNKPVLIVGLVAIAIMCLFPPWSVYDGGVLQAVEYRGFMYPYVEGELRYEIDTTRLLVQIHVIALAAGVLAYLIGPQHK